jgi:hypothetical protein
VAVRALAAALLLGLAGLAASAARAEVPYGLELPVACVPGADCWVVRYVDHDPGPGERDYRCGRQTGDGHDGTDFALPHQGAMAGGVEVLAAAPGMVAGLRDGVPDVSVVEGGQEAVAARECGNGVRIDHGEGWATLYCHLRRGSLRVKEGDRVAAGQPLGLVGLSGETSFPHLHFEVRHGEGVVDPFVGLQRTAGCAAGERPLWAPQVMRDLAYQPVVLTGAGFATAAPERDDLRRGWHRETRLPATSPALVLWTEALWVEAGDRVQFRILGPAGEPLVDHTVAIDAAHRTWSGFAGAPRPGEGWPAGAYRGEVMLERGDTAIRQRVVLQREVALR